MLSAPLRSGLEECKYDYIDVPNLSREHLVSTSVHNIAR